MGPITLFDKSFLQSLSVDEALWFDHFFLSNVCPLFYVETLADLDKKTQRRTPDEEVSIISRKFPEMHSSPNMHHATLCIQNLLGNAIPLTGQIVMAGGRPVNAGGQTGVVYDRSPEAEAFARWQKGEFLEVERLFAKIWRGTLKSLKLDELAKTFRTLGIDSQSCKSLHEAKSIAERVVNGTDSPFERMKLAILFFNIPEQLHRPIIQKWSVAGYPSLLYYAPYAAHVLSVDIFFQIALSANLISTDRPSNRIDIAYLYYLPFCMMFVSSDRLHHKCAPLFLRPDQEFVWGLDLKADLQRLNAHYSSLPDSTKEHGIMAFASGPPKEDDYFVTKLWDRHLPRWRGIYNNDELKLPTKNEKLTEHISKFSKAPDLKPEEVDFDLSNPDAVILERRVSKKRGSWWQLPKYLKEDEK
jgi:hypothetical protein